MQFAIPTTKDGMFSTLAEIYAFYRLSRFEYVGTELDELKIEKLEMDIPNETELKERARLNTFSSQAKEKRNYIDGLNSQLAELSQKLSTIDSEYQTSVKAIEEEYSALVTKLNAEAVCSDTEGSGIVFSEITRLGIQKAQKLAELLQEAEEKKSDVNSEITAITQKISLADAFYAEAHSAETEAEYLRLKEEAEALRAEVFKYNNLVAEKLIKYNNTLKQSQASLELKFLSIKSQPLTKEELVELGYYTDVINCVCGYYNRLEAITAYNDIKVEGRLAIYLEDYYQNIVYLYKTRAG